MKRRVVAALCALACATASAAPVAFVGSADFASDSDGFHATRLRAGALFSYRSHLDYAGVAAQDTRYSHDGWSRDAAGVVALWRKQDEKTLAGVLAEAGLVEVAGHVRAVGDVTWSFRPAPSTGVELIAAGDVVDTRNAIERGIAYGFFAASVEQQISERVTVIGLAGYQPFTDGNDRVHLRARAIFDAIPEHGVTLQLRWRGYESSRSDVDGAYFNPDRYRQWLGAVAIRKRYAGWIWLGTLGGGRETVDGSATQPIAHAEVRAEGPIAGKLRLALHAVYSTSTGYVDAPDYSYRRVGATLIYPF